MKQNHPIVTPKEITCIRCERLKPFDVILTASPSVKSKAIRTATRGDYSHASIVVSPSLRFESVGQGLMFTPVTYWDVVDLEERVLLEDVSAYEHVKVLRHPEMEVMDEQRIRQMQLELNVLLSVLQYDHYPSIGAFREIFPDNFPGKSLKLAVERIGRLQQSKVNTGYFCSELVAHLYELFGLPLFDEPKEPNQVSPNDLNRSRLVAQDVFMTGAEAGQGKRSEIGLLAANHAALAIRLNSYATKQSIRDQMTLLAKLVPPVTQVKEEVDKVLADAAISRTVIDADRQFIGK